MRVALARPGAFALCLLFAGCGARSPLEAGEPSEEPVTEPLPEPKPKPTPNPNPTPNPTPEPEPEPEPEPTEDVRVAGCVSLCQGGCAFPGRVLGTRLDTGELVFPSNLASGIGGSCSAELPFGTPLLVEAEVNRGFRFLWWESGGNAMWQPCPFSGLVEPSFELVVEAPVYCGAVYAKN